MPKVSKSVILLDMDGVVNNNRNMFVAEYTPYAGKCTPRDLDPVSIGIVNKIARLTETDIILMSSWAVGMTPGKLQKLSKATGIPFVDFVPDFGVRRGTQVERWLADHPEVKNFVIIDDEIAHHSSTYMDKVIHVDENLGITGKHIDEIGEILGADVWSLAIQDRERRFVLAKQQ